jgi:pyrroloquinoline quinone (PQQ) biosynthesis protein C
LVDKISTSSIEDLVMINAVIEKYNENKEWFREHGRAEFLKID